MRHLFQSKEPTASRLLSLHNLKWTIDLVASMRSAIIDGTFESLREEILHTWA
ncbi:MAG: hypothetical protein VXW98_03455 [Actinomycetota bacterium]|nr:hypothetical protein [Actinomycetota bacterium]